MGSVNPFGLGSRHWQDLRGTSRGTSRLRFWRHLDCLMSWRLLVMGSTLISHGRSNQLVEGYLSQQQMKLHIQFFYARAWPDYCSCKQKGWISAWKQIRVYQNNPNIHWDAKRFRQCNWSPSFLIFITANSNATLMVTDCWQVLHRGILQQTCQKKPKESERPSNMEFSGSHRTFSIKQRKFSILRIHTMLCPMSSKKLCCM